MSIPGRVDDERYEAALTVGQLLELRDDDGVFTAREQQAIVDGRSRLGIPNGFGPLEDDPGRGGTADGVAVPPNPDPETPTLWRTRAACLGLPTAWWYPSRGEWFYYAPLAKAVCQSCPVAAECLADAVADDALAGAIVLRFGIRAGLSPEQRAAGLTVANAVDVSA